MAKNRGLIRRAGGRPTGVGVAAGNVPVPVPVPVV